MNRLDSVQYPPVWVEFIRFAVVKPDAPSMMFWAVARCDTRVMPSVADRLAVWLFTWRAEPGRTKLATDVFSRNLTHASGGSDR